MPRFHRGAPQNMSLAGYDLTDLERKLLEALQRVLRAAWWVIRPKEKKSRPQEPPGRTP